MRNAYWRDWKSSYAFGWWVSRGVLPRANAARQVLIGNKHVIIGPQLPAFVATEVAQQIIAGLISGVHTRDIDLQSADKAATIQSHPAFGALAGRIFISNLHKETNESFSETFQQLHAAGLVSAKYATFVAEYADELDLAIQHHRDYKYTYFAAMTLVKTYLKKINGVVKERPQYALMREAIQFYCGDMAQVLEVYEALSKCYFGHATPTKYNACSEYPQMASCFLKTMHEDSIPGIYKTLTDCALISKNAGGIGLSVHDIRSKGSYIAGTDGHSNGLPPMLKVFEATALYVDQGGGKLWRCHDAR